LLDEGSARHQEAWRIIANLIGQPSPDRRRTAGNPPGRPPLAAAAAHLVSWTAGNPSPPSMRMRRPPPGEVAMTTPSTVSFLPLLPLKRASYPCSAALVLARLAGLAVIGLGL